MLRGFWEAGKCLTSAVMNHMKSSIVANTEFPSC